MTHQKTVAAPIVKAIIEVLEDLDFSAINACRYVGINLEELELPHGRIEEVKVYKLMAMVNNLCKRPTLALEIGERMLPTMLGTWGYSLITAETFSEIVTRVQKYKSFIFESLKFDIKRHPSHYTVELKTQFQKTDCDYFIVDILKANAAKTLRWLLGESMTPIEIHFQRPKPSNLQDYQEYFKCPLIFNADTNFTKLPIEAFEKLNPSRNKNIDRQNTHEFLRLIEESSQPGLVSRVREYIKSHLSQGEATMDVVAKKYSVSERTLLRRLKEEGYTFQQLVDETRKQSSIYYLEKTATSLQEIAFLLGFKDASTFYRAFKRWHGVTPRQYRLSSSQTVTTLTNPAIPTTLDQNQGNTNPPF